MSPMLAQRRPPGVADLRVDTAPRAPPPSPPPPDAIAPLSTRGVFLLVTAFLAFAAFVLFVLSEMTHHHRQHMLLHAPLDREADAERAGSWTALLLFSPAMQRDVHAASVWTLLLTVPVTSAAAWFPVSITHAGEGALRIRTPATPSSPSTPTATLLQTLPLLQRIATRFRTDHYFRAYQTAAWTLYAVFLVLVLGCAPSSTLSQLSRAGQSPQAIPYALLRLAPFCDFEHRSNVAVAAFLAQVLMISSVLALERGRDRRRRRAAGGAKAQARSDRFVLVLNNFCNSLLFVGALLLAVVSEYTRHANRGRSDGYSLSSGLGSLALFVTAMLNTYGLGGLLARKPGWRFYQPFMGGAKFVLFQIISWTCFAAGVLVQGLYLLSLVLVEMELFVGVMAVAGALFAVSQVVMMMSVLVFRSPSASSTEVSTTPSARRGFNARLQAFADECLGTLLVTFLVNLQWLPSASFFVLYALTTSLDAAGIVCYGLATILGEVFFVLSRSIAIHMYSKESNQGKDASVSPYKLKFLALPALSLVLPSYATYYHFVHDLDALVPVAILSGFVYLYALTYRGDPQYTGVRTNEALMASHSKLIETVATYFSGRIIRVAPLDPAQNYVMAFHPHGIMATSAMWVSFTEQWHRLFPGVQPRLLTASVLHQIPLARDVIQMYGSREVTRQAFSATLDERGSVMLVPGGQAEMLEQRTGRNEVRVYTKHKGFIRVAIEHGTPLVPMLSFKEGELMDNVKAPLVQRWFIKNLAFPFPYFPYGRGFLPIPRKVNATIVVGAAIPVAKIESPTAEDVDKVHAQYFAALEEMFHTHKADAGCADYKLVLI
ncbi:hypothetical protein PybrP1_004807 [[Pythium] brassicae (nom. inval.)]|nr:hypothetical protein PybrP1_004807 [[Pythium] brassicae (nom. inval.)]